MVMTFTHLNIIFSILRFSDCSPVVDGGFVKLTSDSFCGSTVLKINIQFFCHLCCSKSVIFRINLSQWMMISFCQCWFSPTYVVFPWFVCADMTLETVAPDTPINVAVLSQMLQLNAHQRSGLFQNRTSCPFSDFFHTNCHSMQSLMHWHEHSTEYKQTEEYSVLPTEVLSM
jgi:hypothetical protein